MGISRTACNTFEHLSQATLLAYLPSSIDADHVIEASTGKTLTITKESRLVVNSNIGNGVWLKIETLLPRKLLVNNLNKWVITSFDPITRIVCVTFITPVGLRRFTFTLPQIKT